MRIGLVCPDVKGHLNPITTLGQELNDLGHEVTLFGLSIAEEVAMRAGLRFVCIDSSTDDSLGDLEQQLESLRLKLAKSSKFQSMICTGRMFGLVAKMQMAMLPELFSSHRIDGLVVDQFSPAAFVVAKKLGIPRVVASCALAVYWDPGMPPPPLPWNYRNDTFGRIRNQIAAHALGAIYSSMANEWSTGINPLMLAWKLDADDMRIAQQPKFFDFPRKQPTEAFHYTGPWHRPARDDGDLDFPWQWLDDRPLIYASMGTLQNGLTNTFRAIMEAVEELPMQVVIIKGGGDVMIDTPVPENVLIVENAPQLRLLERASMAITHAGLNTVLECLGNGVPMLCLPVTNDQPGVAKRVEWIGAGRMLAIGKANATRIRRELQALLEDAKYRANAEKAKTDIQQASGLKTAAQLVEAAFSR